MLPLFIATQTLSAEVGLNFTGRIQFVGFGPTSDYGGTYGIRLPAFSTLSGHLFYESNSPSYSISTDTCVDCMAYHHKQANGLHVQFQGLTLQADEYIVQVKNDIDVSSYGQADVLSFWYPEPRDPLGQQMNKPLLINGSPVSKGGFLVNFVAPTTAFTSSELPTNIDPSVFAPSVGFGTFGDGLPEYNTLDVYFRPTSISTITFSTSDHDLDGDVDGRDFLIWQREFGNTTGDGDADSNLLVNQNDLNLWQASYGFNSSQLFHTAIPEPNTIALLVCASLLCIVRD
jgi:hypothetical protein